MTFKMSTESKPRFECNTEPDDSIKDGKDKDVTKIMFPVAFNSQHG